MIKAVTKARYWISYLNRVKTMALLNTICQLNVTCVFVRTGAR